MRTWPLAALFACAHAPAIDLAKASWVELDRTFSTWVETEATVIEKLQHAGATEPKIAKRIVRFEEAVERWDYLALAILAAFSADDSVEAARLADQARALLHQLTDLP